MVSPALIGSGFVSTWMIASRLVEKSGSSPSPEQKSAASTRIAVFAGIAALMTSSAGTGVRSRITISEAVSTMRTGSISAPLAETASASCRISLVSASRPVPAEGGSGVKPARRPAGLIVSAA